MKRLFILLVVLLAVSSVQAQGNLQERGQGREQTEARENHTGPHFAFVETEFDLDNIQHSLPRIEHRFEFTNDGTEPLVITKTLTSCNCVKVQYDKRPVPPGGRGAITVVYEVNKKEAGVFYKVIEITSNATERRTNLILKGNAVE